LTNDFPLTYQARGKLRRAAALARRAPEDERVAAVLDDGLRFRVPVRAPHLRDALEAEHAAPAEFPQARERVLETVDLAQRVELVDDEPEPPIALPARHRLEDRKAQPGRNQPPESGNLACRVRQEGGRPGLPSPTAAPRAATHRWP
jgi:hypothetical protein